MRIHEAFVSLYKKVLSSFNYHAVLIGEMDHPSLFEHLGRSFLLSYRLHNSHQRNVVTRRWTLWAQEKETKSIFVVN